MHTIHDDQKNHSHLGDALALAALGAGMIAGRWIRKRQTAARQKRAALAAPSVAEPSTALVDAFARANAQLELDRAAPALPSLLAAGVAPSLLAAGVAPSADASDAPAEPETFSVDVRGSQISTRGDASGDAMLRWRTFRDALIDARGHSADANGTLYPNTTFNDVQQVAALWTDWLAAEPHVMPDNLMVRVRWMLACTGINVSLRDGTPGALYPKNERFWLADLHDLAAAIAKHEDEFPFRGMDALIKKLGAQRDADLHGHSAAAFAAAETVLADSPLPTSAPVETDCDIHGHRSGDPNGSTGQGGDTEPCDTHDHRSGNDEPAEPGTDCDEPDNTHDHRSDGGDMSAVLAQQAAFVGMRVLDGAARALRSPSVLGALLAFSGAALIASKR